MVDHVMTVTRGVSSSVPTVDGEKGRVGGVGRVSLSTCGYAVGPSALPNPGNRGIAQGGDA